MDKSINAEACILSGVFNQPESILRIVNDVEEVYFTHLAHKIIFRTMKEMFLDNIDIDVVTVIDRLTIDKTLKNAGGVAYINDLVDVVVSAGNINSWVKIVKDNYVLNTLISTSKGIVSRCTNHSEKVEDILDQSQKEILSISSAKSAPFKTILEVSTNLMQNKEDIVSGNVKTQRFYTGIDFLDHNLVIKKGKLVVVGAKRSVGKSVLGNTIAFLNSRSKGDKCGIFNLEMTAEEVLERELCRSGRITMDSVVTPSMGDVSNLSDEIEAVQECNVLIDDASSQSLATIRAKSMQMKQRMAGLDLIIVDYLQLMRTLSGDNREQAVASLSRGLKSIAKDLDIAVVALTQLNANGKARESLAIEQDCDIFVKIVRPKFENDNQDLTIKVKNKEVEVNSIYYALIIIAKNRQGNVGIEEAWFNGKHQRFENYTGQMEEQE